MAKDITYLTRDQQSIFDLAVQLYGDISKIGNLLELFPNLDQAITLNSKVVYPPQNDPIAKYFIDNKLIVATDIVYSAPPPIDDLVYYDTLSYVLYDDNSNVRYQI